MEQSEKIETSRRVYPGGFLGTASGAGRPTSDRKAHLADRLLLGRMLEALGNPPLSLVLWDGQEVASTAAPTLARVQIRDRGALLRLISNPEFRFGELYVAGRI